jgi:hypothetical protein
VADFNTLVSQCPLSRADWDPDFAVVNLTNMSLLQVLEKGVVTRERRSIWVGGTHGRPRHFKCLFARFLCTSPVEDNGIEPLKRLCASDIDPFGSSAEAGISLPDLPAISPIGSNNTPLA